MADRPPSSHGQDLVACAVCGSPGRHKEFDSYEYLDQTYALVKCEDCESIFVLDPCRTDYTSHTAEESAIRDYVELNASIDSIGVNLLTALKDRVPGRLLDIGCGFGFGTDIARRLAGWDVVGVEPSNYGRAGAAALGLRMYHDYIDADHALAKQQFEAIFSSEVIEHIDDPRAFLALARSMLAPGGLLVIGTPDAASLSEPLDESERLAVLSPGAHLFMMSQRAMRFLLEEQGFRHIKIHRRGTSMVAYASEEPFTLASLDPIVVGRDYAQDVLRDGVENDSLRLGLTFRLFRYLIDLGELECASAMVADLPPLRVDLLQPVATFDDYLQIYPASGGPLAYYLAMLRLNFDQNFAAAADAFLQAFMLCDLKARLAPWLAVVENNLKWASLYHAGVAYKAVGNAPLAVALWQSITTATSPPLAWKELADDQLSLVVKVE